MKKIIALAICLLTLAAVSANAQDNASTKKQLAEKGIKLKMAFDDYKDLYNPKDYVRQEFDPYSPIGTGIASFFIPGLGQMINGEGGRGALMLGGHILLGGTGLVTLMYCVAKNNSANTAVGIISAACLCADLALDIWSIIDAVNIAKVKNMYYQDCQTLRASSLDIKLMPSLAMVPAGQGNRAAAGMTLAITF